MQDIRAFPAPKGAVGLWRLGQNGFIFTSPEGTVVSTGLYLTGSCAALGASIGVDPGRAVPVLLKPEDVDVTDLNHMGFLLQPGNGPKIYIAGGTDYSELLEEAAAHSPDTVITVINGGFNNLSHWEAARLVKAVKPKAAIPCHYDMFRTNSADPGMFEASLRIQGGQAKCWELRHGEASVFGG